METWLVGGAVRDSLLGRPVKDRDWVVVGATPEDMLSRGFSQVGADFPVFLHPETNEEYALARTERKSGRGYGGFEVKTSPDVTLEEDLARRDLTINAMALAPSGSLVDPYGGREDLAAKVLRHTTEAFKDDPLRLVRVARFAARFGPEWAVAPETKALLAEMVSSGEVDYLTPERVWKEFEKGFSEQHPSRMANLLHELGAFDRPPFQEYAGWRPDSDKPGLVDLAAYNGEQVKVVFALAFDPASTRTSRLPADVRDMVRLLADARGFDHAAASPEERLALLEKLDGLRQTDRLGAVLNGLKYLDEGSAKGLARDAGTLLKLSSREIIRGETDGRVIKEKIRTARLSALEQQSGREMG